eukprot:7577206-Pyramimonas_sp.AAC.1
MLKVKKSQFEDLIGQRTPDLDDMDDAWAEEPKEPFPQGPEADQPAEAAQPPPGEAKVDKTEEEKDN